MPGGRPTKYSDVILEKTRDYIDNYEDCDDAIPSIAGLAVELGVSRETVRAWGKEEGKEAFSAMLAEMLAVQERTLIGKGLRGEFNSNIAKLVLAKHGYAEKHESSGPEGGPMVVEIVSFADSSAG